MNNFIINLGITVKNLTAIVNPNKSNDLIKNSDSLNNSLKVINNKTERNSDSTISKGIQEQMNTLNQLKNKVIKTSQENKSLINKIVNNNSDVLINITPVNLTNVFNNSLTNINPINDKDSYNPLPFDERIKEYKDHTNRKDYFNNVSNDLTDKANLPSIIYTNSNEVNNSSSDVNKISTNIRNDPLMENAQEIFQNINSESLIDILHVNSNDSSNQIYIEKISESLIDFLQNYFFFLFIYS